MIWRAEQRAIGELMRIYGDPPRCVSFDSFAHQYDERFARWFETFADHLDPASAPQSNRLAELQRLLSTLIRQLDVDRLLVRVGREGVLTEPRWARPSMHDVTAHSDPIQRPPPES